MKPAMSHSFPEPNIAHLFSSPESGFVRHEQHQDPHEELKNKVLLRGPQPWSPSKSFLSNPMKKTIPETSPAICQHLGASPCLTVGQKSGHERHSKKRPRCKKAAPKDSKAWPWPELREARWCLAAVLPEPGCDHPVPPFKQYPPLRELCKCSRTCFPAPALPSTSRSRGPGRIAPKEAQLQVTC